MAYGKSWLRAATLLLSGLLSACNLWGANMKANEFFEPRQVELLETIQRGDKAKANQILEEGLTLNTHGKDGITPLLWLIMQKDHQAVELALELGADPNLPASDGDTPVTLMAGGDDNEILRIILEHGGDPNSKDRNKKPALFGAISQERWDNLKTLLEYGADPDQTDGPNRNSVQYAGYLNKFEIAHYLIEQGANYSNRDSVGSDIAWEVHEGLNKGILNPDSPAYEWAQKVKEQLKKRGIEFPPPSPKEIQEQWKREGKW